MVGNHKWDTWFVEFVIGLYALCFDYIFFSSSFSLHVPATFSFIIIIHIRTQISIYWIKFGFQCLSSTSFFCFFFFRMVLPKTFSTQFFCMVFVTCYFSLYFILFYYFVSSLILAGKPDPTTGFLNQNATPWTSITLILHTTHTHIYKTL